jgi:peroxiredoxin
MAKRTRRNGVRKGRRRTPAPPPSALGPNWRTLAIVLLLFLVVSVSVYAVMTRPADKDNNDDEDVKLPAADKAPSFTLQTIDGEAISLDDFKGKVVVLDMMATWCNPCVMQMEELNQLRATYSESKVVILSIDIDTKESAQQLQTFKEDNNAHWRFARDTDGVGDKYGVTNIPALVIIDKDGRLQWQDAGVTSYEDLKGRIEPLL